MPPLVAVTVTVPVSEARGVTTRVTDCEAVTGGTSLSVISALKVNVPGWLGIPPKFPYRSIVNPDGALALRAKL